MFDPTLKEIPNMNKTCKSMLLALSCAIIVFGATRLKAADDAAKVAGTWEISTEGPNGTMTQTLNLQQDGGTIKGTISGRRGETPVTGTIDGNKVTFQAKREGQNGTFVTDYTATVDGDTMKGKLHNERFGDHDFTAKRK
jgi:hypothetical protein